MSAKTFTIEDAQTANITLVGPEKGAQAVHDLVTAYQANRRTGTACTKTRGEVRGNNKKIYRQKGTGNARHGDKRAPIFVGGGVAFGPRPRDYSKKVNKNTRRLALRRVLGDLIRDNRIVSVDSFAVEDGKTKSFIAAVSAITTPAKILIVAPGFDEMTFRAARNVQWVQLVNSADVNIEQLLLAKTVILVGDATAALAERTA